MRQGIRVAVLCVLLTIVGSVPAWARGKIQGFVEKGGVSFVAPGSGVTKKAQQSFPSSFIVVYLAGTVTPATIYSDAVGTAKANPFTVSTDGSYSFYVDVCVDVRFYGTGIASPWTEGDRCPDALYVLKTGDTMTGALALPSNGLTVGTTQLAVSGGNTSFSGKVAIGGANQGYRLDVKTTSSGDATFDTIANFCKASTNETNLLLRATNTLIDIGATNILGGGGPQSALSFSTTPAGGVLAERVRINSSGEFGIAKTATAGVELDVNGDVAASGSLKVGPYSWIGAFFPSTTSTASAGNARAVQFDGTLAASANNDTLVGLYLDYSADVGAFTGVNTYALYQPASGKKNYFAGSVGVGAVPTSPLQVVGLPVYANNAAALAGGLTAGAFYRTGADPDPVCVVH